MSGIFAKHFFSSSSLPVRVLYACRQVYRLPLLYNFSVLKLKIIHPIIDFLEWTQLYNYNIDSTTLSQKNIYTKQKFIEIQYLNLIKSPTVLPTHSPTLFDYIM